VSSWAFRGPTAPFLDPSGDDPARFVFEQVSDDSFSLAQGFRYDDGEVVVEVPHTTTVTDLASIPLFMAWFVPVNGRHTPAAVVHDKLVRDSREHLDADRHDRRRRRESAQMRAAADDVFLAAMEATQVPLLRRHIMHAAVVMGTRWSRGGAARAGIALWVLASLVGTLALVWSIAAGRPLVALASAAAPLPGALLWGTRRYRSAVLAGYAALLIALPALATAIGYAVYWAAEQAARVLTPGVRRAATPPPAGYR
jgi:hypothetical protein